MSGRSFFRNRAPLTVAEVAALTGAELRRNPDPERRITGIAVLDRAGPQDLVFLDNLKFAVQAGGCVAGACLVTEQFAGFVPDPVAVVVVKQPFHAFVTVARALFPDALRPSSLFDGARAPGAVLHPSARLESGVTIDPGAVIGPGAEIGSGTLIGANAVIGAGVHIGRDCSIGPNATIVHALIGDRVIIHAGCHIGQDGFGYLMGASGHRKIPQVGRVIIQDDVEIGAGSAIDRGAFRDTVIGEGTKIDNQVQVGHNVTIGRHCVLVAQSGVAGSATLEDYVVLGAKVGIKDHLTIGEGAQIAASSNLGVDVPAGGRWAGTPARPYTQWVQQERYLTRIGRSTQGQDRRDNE
jgi:UDP-3-O-[3-hydroxymyristoyl] glucosamine N-acyltransferase